MTDNVDGEQLVFVVTRLAGSKFRIVVKAGTATIFADTVSPCSAGSRLLFTRKLQQKAPAADAEKVEAELLRLVDLLTSPGPSGGTGDTSAGHTGSDVLTDTPQDVIDAANEILDDPDLIARVCDACTTVGIAGERELSTTIYLIGTSRLLPRPLAGIVRGSSSSGKSYIIDCVSSLFPDEGLVRATQMTQQSLFHMPPGGLVSRWVVAGERSRIEDDERAEATRALREMLASGRLSKLMPVKVAGGNIETQLIHQDGPIAFVETTTLTNVFEEDANRCLLLQTDESPEQTKRIIQAMAEIRDPDVVGRVVAVHHAIQRMLPSDPVEVPFTSRLGLLFPTSRVEFRRAFPQLLSLIKACALLHYRQRDRGENGAILADARDYHIARRLIVGPFAQALGGSLPQATLDFLARLPTGEEFTAKSIAHRIGCSISATNGWLAQLNGAGCVEAVELGRGPKPTIWKATGRLPDCKGESLPTLEAVFPGLSEHQHSKTAAPDGLWATTDTLLPD